MFIGVYSSRKKLEEAKERLRRRPGFRDYPDGFRVRCDRMDEEYDDPMFFTPWAPGQPAVAVLGEAIGVGTMAGPFIVLLPRGTALPASYSGVFSTAVAGQPAASVMLVAGDPSLDGVARRLGQLVVPDLPPAPPGLLQVQLWLAVDERGAMSASARHVRTGEAFASAAGAVAVDPPHGGA
ncbi:MAG TPA: Hsp70 family protein [Gemmataceae bacterium]|jgi:hypothetical protein|nr:Hsp70 family protein [Gemmataceae bacterium]